MKKSFSWLIWKILWERKSPFARRECWFCFPALKWLNSLPKKNWEVLEYGGGGSTLYFSDNCLKVDTIENNTEFKTKIKNYLIKSNVEFVDAPQQKYDLILIDSNNSDREKEFHDSKNFLKPKGIIIFDNIDRYKNLRKEMYFIFNGWALDYAGQTFTGIWFNNKKRCVNCLSKDAVAGSLCWECYKKDINIGGF